MSVDLKEFGERLNSLLKNPKDESGKKTARIKQKDLAKDIGVSENAIKHWKDGDWDIKISNIYLIVEYIQNHFPASKPMQKLFSDLLADEIQKVREDSFNKGKKEADNELENAKINHGKEISKLKGQVSDLENEIYQIKCAVNRLDDTEKTHLQFALGKKS